MAGIHEFLWDRDGKRPGLFSRRKSIKVNGTYTQRDIYLWYSRKNGKNLKPMVDKIKENAARILEMDRKSGFL